MEAGPREGWYGDPEEPARLRWWDGSRWTEHTRERPGEAPAPETDRRAQELLAMPVPSVPPPDDPTRRLLPWLIGGLVLLLALGATGIVLGSSEDENEPPVTTTPPIDPEAESADATAQALVRTAQTAIETWATDHGGSYDAATPEELIRIEPGLNGATLTVDAAETNYSVSVESTSGGTFTITRDDAGGMTFTCAPPAAGACPASGFWS